MLRCVFCEEAAHVSGVVCERCGKRIAEIAIEGALDIWGDTSSDEEMSPLKAEIAKSISETDAASHYDLAIAYREMAMHVDAARSAGTTLYFAKSTSLAHDALNVLLSPPVLRPKGLALLKARLLATKNGDGDE